MCSRCKACDSILSVYDMTVKRKIKLDNGNIKEVYEDLCGRCRGAIRDMEEPSDDLDNMIELED